MRRERTLLQAGRRFPLKAAHKVAASCAGAVLLVAFVAAVSLWAFSQIEQAAAARKHIYTTIQRADELLSALKDAETGQRGYMLTGDEVYLEPYLAVRDGINGQLEELRRSTSDNAAAKHLGAIAPLMHDKLAELSESIEARRNRDMPAALAIVGSGRGKQLMDSIRAETNSFIKLEENALAQSDEDLRSGMHDLFALIIAASVVMLLFAFSFTYLIYRETRHRLKNAAHRETQHLLDLQKETNKVLEHSSRMKSDFLATMSHELRTPLNAIIGFSEALKEGLVGPLSDPQREYIGDIFTGGQHLLALINDILDLSKIEAGMMALELEEVDVKTLLSNSLSIVKEKAALRRIHVELETGEDLGLPQLDLRKTKQIVYNLLSNAVKFSADGGRVTLRARRVPRSNVGSMSGTRPVHGFPLPDSEFSEFLEISVADSGIGISQENIAKLFQAFTQIDSSLARKFEGTGLGLALVKQLAELHGGAVAVSSAEGEGACFAVWLPLRTLPQAAAVLPQHARAAVKISNELLSRIALVVEDDATTADLVRLLLEAEGFTVIHAANAETALELAAQYTLSLISLDIQLPGMDGWEFLQRIRESATLARVPVVIVAGVVDSNLALTRGAAAVLQKPISRAQLKTSLADLGLQSTTERTHTILVVDDDPKAVEVIAAFLPAPAYAVVRAYGGGEAIALAQQLRPDLILLDLMMPEVSGFDVVDALQRNPNTAFIPILVVTAKQVTAQDRAALTGNLGKGIRIMEKAGFNSIRFIAEVRRALLPI
jgi:signal transduction histidine kinase/CheY-like chemotaxis protein